MSATRRKIFQLLAPVVPRFSKRSLCDGEVGGGSGSVNTIYSRKEVADDLISGQDVETYRDYVCVNLWVASVSSFP